MSSLYRVLKHKLCQVLSTSAASDIGTGTGMGMGRIIVPRTEDDQVLVAGVVTALGAISVAQAAWHALFANSDITSTNTTSTTINTINTINTTEIIEIGADTMNESKTTNTVTVNDNEKATDDLLNVINTILLLPSIKPDTPPLGSTLGGVGGLGGAAGKPPGRPEYTELKVVALRVLRTLACSGLLTNNTKTSVVDDSMNRAVTYNSSDDTKECNRDSLSSDNKGDNKSDRKTDIRAKTFSLLVGIVKGYDPIEAVKPVNGASNGRSSGMSSIVGAAVDVLSCACLARVKDGRSY